MRLGLTGGIGSGKSEVARIFAARGALLIDADALARDAVARGSRGLGEIALLWPAVIANDGTLNRAALANIVFDDATARERLNAIIHPEVRRLAAEIEATAKPGRVRTGADTGSSRPAGGCARSRVAPGAGRRRGA